MKKMFPLLIVNSLLAGCTNMSNPSNDLMNATNQRSLLASPAEQKKQKNRKKSGKRTNVIFKSEENSSK